MGDSDVRVSGSFPTLGNVFVEWLLRHASDSEPLLFVFRYQVLGVELSTTSHVKDLKKLKPRARALRFFMFMINMT